MRVPSTAISESLASQLGQLNARQYRLQNQAVTGQRVQWAADDPAAMQRALQTQAEARSTSQYAKNIVFLQERTTATLDSVRSLQRVVDRAAEIATLADGTKSPTELAAYAAEVDQLIRQGVGSANARHGDDYLLGGTRTERPPFVLTESAAGQVASVAYQGNPGVAELEIGPGTTVSLQMPGANPTAAGPAGVVTDSRAGADLFAHLISLRDHLAAGDTAAVAQSDRTALARDEDNLLSHIAGRGAVQARLETASAAAADRSLALRESFSRETDADLAQTLVELSTTQTAYRAALQSGANLLNTSLMDFLR